MTTNNEGPGSAGNAPRHEAEGPKITDALYQAFPNKPPMVGTDPKDGMPRPAISQAWQDAQAPALVRSKFVCMGDYSKFVIRGRWGRISAEFEPGEVERMPNGEWTVPMPLAVDRLALKADEEFDATASDRCDVEPIRPQCTHYVRQLVPFPEEKDHTLAVRLCTARRTDEGEFLDLGNSAILACELRSPPFGNEQAKIDEFDEATIASAKKSVVEDDFDVEAALSGEPTISKQ